MDLFVEAQKSFLSELYTLNDNLQVGDIKMALKRIESLIKELRDDISISESKSNENILEEVTKITDCEYDNNWQEAMKDLLKAYEGACDVIEELQEKNENLLKEGKFPSYEQEIGYKNW